MFRGAHAFFVEKERRIPILHLVYQHQWIVIYSRNFLSSPFRPKHQKTLLLLLYVRSYHMHFPRTSMEVHTHAYMIFIQAYAYIFIQKYISIFHCKSMNDVCVTHDVYVYVEKAAQSFEVCTWFHRHTQSNIPPQNRTTRNLPSSHMLISIAPFVIIRYRWDVNECVFSYSNFDLLTKDYEGRKMN